MVRLMYGGRTSIYVGLAAALVTTILAVIVALLAGYYRGWIDAVLSRTMDIIWAFPVLLLGIALGTTLSIGGLKAGPIQIAGDSLWIPILIIGLVYVPYVARPIRGEILALREKEFIEAAVAQGKGPLRIMFSELLPNIVSTDRRVLHAEHRQQHAAGVGAVVPGRRGAATQRIVGHHDLRRLPGDLHGAAPHRRARVDDRRNGAVAERVRRRPARRDGPAREDPAGALRPMARFVARRLLGMIAVLFAISVIVFLIFNVIPNSDPAARIAGKNADPALIARVSADLGLDKPLPVQYLTMMKQIFTGQLTSYAKDRNVVQQIWEGLPATFSLCIGAAVLWMSLAILFGYLSAVHAGRFTDRALTILSLVGISMPVFWLAAMLLYFLSFKVRAVPDGQLRAADGESGRLGVSPDTAVVHARRAVRRHLQPRAAIQHARRDERGLRAHRTGQGAVRTPGADPPRASQLDDPGHHPVRTRLRHGGRRRRDPHRDGLQPRRCRDCMRERRSGRWTCHR